MEAPYHHTFSDLVNVCFTQMQFLHIIQKRAIYIYFLNSYICLASFLQINAAPNGFGKTLIHK